jgi:serine/threonine-protein kinase
METFAKFALLERISSGEQYDVFLARPTTGKAKPLVVKRLKPHVNKDGTFREAVSAAAESAASLEHEGIALIEGFGAEDGRLYVARSYVPGKDVRSLIRRHAVQRQLVPRTVATYLVARLAETLVYAHQEMVHGCLTPRDIIIDFDGGVRLINFGMGEYWAKVASTGGELPEDKAGYLAPEQVTSGTVDPRSDIFAVGLVFHELLTGKPALPDGLDPQRVEQLGQEGLPPPESRRAEIDDAVVAVVMRAVEIDPDRRYQTAAELRDALSELGHGTREETSQLMQRVFGSEALLEKQRSEMISSELPPASESESRSLPRGATINRPVVGHPAVEPRRDGKSTAALLIGLIGVALLGAAVYLLTKRDGTGETRVAAATQPDRGLQGGPPGQAQGEDAAREIDPDRGAATDPKAEPRTAPDRPEPAVALSPRRSKRERSRRRRRARQPRPKKPKPSRLDPAPTAPEPKPKPPPEPKPKAAPPAAKVAPKPKPAPPEPKPAPPPEPRSERGFVRIVSSVPIEVVVDGWKTPVKRSVMLKLTPGRHNLTVIFKTSGKKLQRALDVKPGKTITLKLVRGQ